MPTLKHKGSIRQIANRGRAAHVPGVFGSTMESAELRPRPDLPLLLV